MSDPPTNEHDRRQEIEGLSFGVASAIAFGTLAIFVKFAYREGADVVPLLALRFGAAFVLLAGFAIVRRTAVVAPAKRILLLMALGGVGYALEAGMFFAALARAPAGVVSLVFYSYPLWTATIALVAGLEPFRWNLLVALGLGLGGLATIFSIPTGAATGELLALASAVAVAVYLVTAQVVTRDVEPAISATWTAAGAALSLTVVAVATEGALPAASVPHGIGLGLATALAFAALYAAVRRIGSSRTAVATMVEPVTTVLLAAILLHERITWRVLIGMLLIVSALPVLAARRGAPPPAAP